MNITNAGTGNPIVNLTEAFGVAVNAGLGM